MKQKTKQALWAAVTTISLSLLAGPVSAQDSTTASDQPKTTGGILGGMKAKMLGNVERANKLIGTEVIGSDNEKLGKLDNLVVDLGSGRILYAVIGSGGLLGVEEHRVAVPPGVFTVTENNTIQLSADKQKLADAPKFKSESERSEKMGQLSFLEQVYHYFGQNPWWKQSTTTETTFNNVHRASTLIGAKIDDNAQQRIGKVEDLSVNLAKGMALYIIVNPDTRLNLGDNYLALPPTALSWNSEQKSFNCDINNEKLAAAPRFPSDSWSNLSNPAFATRVYSYYGKQLFEPGMRETGREPEAMPNKQPQP